MIRIGFRYVDSRVWLGGYNYLKNLCKVIKRYKSDSLQPIVFCGVDPPAHERDEFQQLLGADFVDAPEMHHEKIRQRTPRTLLLGRDRPASEVFAGHDIDLVFENNEFFGRSFEFPTISWIADFQHLHLRHLFSPWQRLRREIGFRSQIHSHRQIMVSSHDAQKDCREFYRAPDEKISVVRFAVPYSGSPPLETYQATREKYGLPDDFFLLPNQFWIHKNHTLVLKSLMQLRDRGENVVVAATGNHTLPRCEKVFNQLKSQIEQHRMEDQFRLLGQVSYGDLVSLMHACRALINPSLFEGWSTTIEEAKTFGVKMILSDLDVNREQVGDGALFFDRYQADDLAQKLVIGKTEFDTQRPDVQELQKSSDQRLSQFADDFAAVVRRTMANKNTIK